MKIHYKKLLAKEVIFFTAAAALSGLLILIVILRNHYYSHNKQIVEKKLEDINNDKKYQELQKETALEQIYIYMVKVDENLSIVYPDNIYEFAKMLIDYEVKKKLFHEILSVHGEWIFRSYNEFDSLVTPSIAIINNREVYDQKKSELIKEENLYNSKLLSINEQNKYIRFIFLLVFAFFYPIRFFFYLLRWSVRTIKS